MSANATSSKVVQGRRHRCSGVLVQFASSAGNDLALTGSFEFEEHAQRQRAVRVAVKVILEDHVIICGQDRGAQPGCHKKREPYG